MKFTLAIILTSLFIFSGCENIIMKNDETSDDKLISAIIEAEQTEIQISDMPSLSKSTINTDYNQYYEINAYLAPKLGYQVLLDAKNYKNGDYNEIYFDLNGKQLISKKRTHHKNGFMCFEIVFPFSLTMPDESSIIINKESEHELIKDWYKSNPNQKEKPYLDYPIDIIFKDGITKTIENDNDMKQMRINCKSWHNDTKNTDCFELFYPIIFKMDDGSNISMEHSQDWSEIKSWYDNNKDSSRPTLIYPVIILYKDGSEKSISNNEEMELEKRNCNN